MSQEPSPGARERLRRIPAVERLLQEPVLRDAVAEGSVPRGLAVDAARAVLEDVRGRVLAGAEVEVAAEGLAARALDVARARAEPRLRQVVNAAGVVLHTNLGRAPVACEAVEAMGRAAGYCNLEYDLERGARGHRHDLVRDLLCELTGAEAGLVVNNNAAAVLLALAALARGREVVVSRGELVEIGGAFRVPEVMVQGGCRLREVGTTNKTHLEDYERAIGPDTALLMRVHTSNYRILGFTEAVSTADLVALGNRRGLPVLEDLGSGSLVDLRRLGLGHEPSVPEVVGAGVDLVTFSGDKLLGGPQAGILVGRRGAVEACAGHPLMRALRPDKVTLAALEATLGLYRDPERVAARVPALAMLALTAEQLKPRAEALAEALARELGPLAEVSVREDVSEVGGGSLPLQELPTWIVEVRRPPAGVSRWEAALRRHRPPVIARVHEDSLVLDPRTLRPGEERTVVEAVTAAVKKEVGR